MRLITQKKTWDDKLKAELLKPLLKFVFSIEKHLALFKNYNYQDTEPAIYAMWHAHQCCIFGLKKETIARTNVLVSRSADGDVIAYGAEYLGFKTIRGSANRAILNKGGVSSTIDMIKALENGENIAIMIDGPNGPAKEVKKGITMIAKHTGMPIIPMTWYSPSKTMITIPTWDKLRFPVGLTKIVNLYAEPIYVPKDASEEDEKNIREHLKQELLRLDELAPEKFKEVWSKKDKK
ncbi:DUF374 domain-containing protein [bacterium]|nr:DUF374 domain-containing protein [bacterium]